MKITFFHKKYKKSIFMKQFFLKNISNLMKRREYILFIFFRKENVVRNVINRKNENHLLLTADRNDEDSNY